MTKVRRAGAAEGGPAVHRPLLSAPGWFCGIASTSSVAADVVGCLRSQGFTGLEITRTASEPAACETTTGTFDRMLIGQAEIEDVALVSDDQVRVRGLW